MSRTGTLATWPKVCICISLDSECSTRDFSSHKSVFRGPCDMRAHLAQLSSLMSPRGSLCMNSLHYDAALAGHSHSTNVQRACAHISSSTFFSSPGCNFTLGLRIMQQLLNVSDCVVEVHDARMAVSGRNPNFDLLRGKARIIVLNKIDLAPPKATEVRDFFCGVPVNHKRTGLSTCTDNC